MKNLAPDLFTMSVQRHEVICCLAYSLKHGIFFGRMSIINLSLMVCTFGVRNTLFDVSRLLLSVALTTFYVTLCSGDQFHNESVGF